MRIRHALAACFSAAGLFLGTNANADFTFATFPNSTGLTLLGSTSINAATNLRVTPNTGSSVGAGWYTAQQAVGAGFSTTFTFRIINQTNGGADGFAFVIQNAGVNTLGTNGCRIGYDGIVNSLAVEFDTYTSGTCDAGTVNDPNDNHISVHTRGALANSSQESASIGIASVLPDMSDGANHTVKINYYPGTLEVYLDDMTTPRITAPIDLAATLSLNSGKAWVGFTGSTGGAGEVHDIRSWSLTEGAPPGSGRPRTPTVTQPVIDGTVANAQDVHMECNTFFSSAGFGHLCSDWEVWTLSPSERIWKIDCITGVERLHVHMGDGQFIGSYTGRTSFLPSTNYQLRVRHRDDSGIAATEYSLYGQRNFTTAAPGQNVPLLVEDIVLPPSWVNSSTQAPIILPAAVSNPPTMYAESAEPMTLVSFAGNDGVSNTVINPGSLPHHHELRVRFEGGSTGISVAASTFSFIDEDCKQFMVYLPAVTLGAGAQALFWASDSGSTYVATAAQDHAVLTTMARGTETPFLVTQPGYVVEKFATGFQLPVNIAFVPNPGPNSNDVFCYVTELYGTVKMVTRGGTVSDYRTGLLNYTPSGAFPGSGEQGLAGIVVDPANGDLYCTLLQDDGSGNHYPRVVRIQSTDGGRTGSTVTTILNMGADAQGQSHQVSNITFGPDGMLYVHNGDGFVASTSQDLTKYRGKILRLNKTGAAPTDNPFYNAADGITSRDFVYAYGVRNPFGGAWRISDNTHIIIENGPSVDRMSKLVTGRNYLYDGSDASMENSALFNWEPSHGPVNGAFIQNEVFAASGYPAAKVGHLFVSESGPTYADGPQALGKRIVEFEINAAGTLVSGPTSFVEYAGAGKGSVVALAAGPDGLYFSDLYKDLNYTSPVDRGASVFRVRYAPSGAVCCTSDFDGDGDFGTDADIEAFFACLGGNCCPTCQSADFDHDGDTGTDADIEAFFRVLGGGAC